ncbi:MAG: Mbeg1-like protein [Acutalibacteraceae bacterium]
MANINEYIKSYGGVSFKDMPFGDADNVALCEIFYLPLEKVVSADLDDEPRDFADVCKDFYEYNGCKHHAVGLVLPRHISVMLQNMAKYKRFQEMKVVGCTETFSVEPAIQFAAATFILPDDTKVVMFRGTDDTLIGWKEDLDIFVKKGIPSHQLAVDYLEKVAEKFDGDIIVCGHSKGGNVALYGALKCSEKVRSRITALYNNDGPGYDSYSIFQTEAYQELLPKYHHIVPNSSLVGMLLAHDNDYTVIRSSRLLGPMQHDLATWKFNGSELQTTNDLSMLGKITDLSLKKLVFNVNEEQSKSFDEVAKKIIAGTGQICLLGFAKNVVSSVKGARKSWKEIDKDTRETFTGAFKKSPEYLKESVATVRQEAKHEKELAKELEKEQRQAAKAEPVTA